MAPNMRSFRLIKSEHYTNATLTRKFWFLNPIGFEELNTCQTSVNVQYLQMWV